MTLVSTCLKMPVKCGCKEIYYVIFLLYKEKVGRDRFKRLWMETINNDMKFKLNIDMVYDKIKWMERIYNPNSLEREG